MSSSNSSAAHSPSSVISMPSVTTVKLNHDNFLLWNNLYLTLEAKTTLDTLMVVFQNHPKSSLLVILKPLLSLNVWTQPSLNRFVKIISFLASSWPPYLNQFLHKWSLIQLPRLLECIGWYLLLSISCTHSINSHTTCNCNKRQQDNH